MTNSISVAIIGAGIGGLATAACLRRVGIEAQVYEQASQFAPIGAGLQLTPNAMKALRGLGLDTHISANGFAPTVGLNRKWDTGEITNSHEMGRAIEEKFGAPDVSMHRALLHDALVALVPSANIHLRHRLISLDTAGAGYKLRFDNGNEVLCDAVIASDGVHSLVRDILFGADKAVYNGQVAYRAVYPTALLKGVPVDDRVKWWGQDRHIVTYKIDPKRDYLYFIASTPEPDFKVESWSAPGDLKVLQAAFDGFHPDAMAILTSCPEVKKWALVERAPLPQWTEGRITLLGDACHPMLPYMAQGAGSAIEDAVVLSRCLQGVALEEYDVAFRRFEANRKPRTSRIQLGASQNQWMKTPADTTWLYGYDPWTIELL